jgi:hypothetical protein
MGETVSITFTREDEKKHSVRFKQGRAMFLSEKGDEIGENITEPVLGTIYVGRKGTSLADARKLRVTIEVVE